MISRTVPGSTSTTSASPVTLRNAVGMLSLSDIRFLLSVFFSEPQLNLRISTVSPASTRRRRGRKKGLLCCSRGQPGDRSLELSDLRFNHCRRRKRDSFGRLQPIAGDGNDSQIIRRDSAQLDKLLCYCDRHA